MKIKIWISKKCVSSGHALNGSKRVSIDRYSAHAYQSHYELVPVDDLHNTYVIFTFYDI